MPCRLQTLWVWAVGHQRAVGHTTITQTHVATRTLATTHTRLFQSSSYITCKIQKLYLLIWKIKDWHQIIFSNISVQINKNKKVQSTWPMPCRYVVGRHKVHIFMDLKIAAISAWTFPQQPPVCCWLAVNFPVFIYKKHHLVPDDIIQQNVWHSSWEHIQYYCWLLSWS